MLPEQTEDVLASNNFTYAMCAPASPHHNPASPAPSTSHIFSSSCRHAWKLCLASRASHCLLWVTYSGLVRGNVWVRAVQVAVSG